MRRTVLPIVCFLQLLLSAACTPRVEPSRTGSKDFGTLPPNEPLVVLESEASFLWNVTPSRRFPRFALYPTGLVIALSSMPSGGTYLTASLSTTEVDALLQSIDARHLPDYADAEYVASTGVHTQSHILSVRRDDGTYAHIRVTGWLNAFPDKAPPMFPPAPLHKAMHQLFEFDLSGAATWTSEEYEIYSWPCGAGSTNANLWPDDWPPLPREAPHAGSMWNVSRLQTGDHVRVQETLGPTINTMHREVSARNKVWCVTYRPILPGEDKWRLVDSTPIAGAN